MVHKPLPGSPGRGFFNVQSKLGHGLLANGVTRGLLQLYPDLRWGSAGQPL